mmetsp:Transcript_3495/g.5198  ORF Transcript_3495/g.5198 Transcript_3495/m.5198 type:complete len:535 (+) Transcript_3495:5-1609(+)
MKENKYIARYENDLIGIDSPGGYLTPEVDDPSDRDSGWDSSRREKVEFGEEEEEKTTKIGRCGGIFQPANIGIVLGCFFIALTSGTTNAFNPIGVEIEKELGLSSQQTNVLTSMGLIGLFFTIPAGMLNDRFGPFITCFGSLFLTAGGYMLASFLSESTYPLMLICLLLVGFGGGATFTCALATIFKVFSSNPGLPVAFVAAGMSLSMAFSGVLTTIYDSASGCDKNECWRGELRVISLACGLIQLPCSFLLRHYYSSSTTTSQQQNDILNEAEFDREYSQIPVDLQSSDEDLPLSHSASAERDLDKLTTNKPEEKPVSIIDSFTILKNAFFLLFALAYNVGIGSGLLVVTQTQQLVVSFAGEQHEDWTTGVSIAFSVANAILGGGLSGFVSDYMVNKKRVSRVRVYAVIFIVYSAIFFAMGVMSTVPSEYTDNMGSKVIFMMLIVLIGVEFGTNFVLGPAIVGELYGGVNFGVYFGYLQVATAISTFAVPALATLNVQSQGNFGYMFFAFQFLLFFSGTAIFFKKPSAIGVWW